MINNAGIKFLKTRNINQESLENLFGMIRSHERRNINPTCSQCTSSSVDKHTQNTINPYNLISKRSMSTNCESKNDDNLLFTLKNFVKDVSQMLTQYRTNSGRRFCRIISNSA